MRTSIRLAGILVAGSIAVAALTACGGDSGKKVDVDDWVQANCDISEDFTKANEEVSAGLDKVDLTDRKAKDDVKKLLDDFGNERKKLADERKKTGTPDVTGGKEVVAAFTKQQKINDKAFATFLKEYDKLDKGKNFEEDFVGLLFDSEPENNLRADIEDLADKRSTKGAQDVLDAFDDDPACAAVYFKEDAVEKPQPTPVAKITPVTSRTPVIGRQTATSGTPVVRATVRANASQDEKWVVGFCNAVQSYLSDVDTLGGGFDIPNNASGQNVKDSLVAFLVDLQKRTATLKGEIDKLGNPEGKDGAKIEAGLSKAAGDLVALFESSVKDARALNANDQTKLIEQLTALGTRLEAAGTAIGDAFDKIDRDFDTKNITKISASTPQCAGIR